MPFCNLLAKFLVSDFQWSFHRHVTFCSMEPDLDDQKVSQILFQDISLIETYSSKSLSSFLGQKGILSTLMSSSWRSVYMTQVHDYTSIIQSNGLTVLNLQQVIFAACGSLFCCNSGTLNFFTSIDTLSFEMKVWSLPITQRPWVRIPLKSRKHFSGLFVIA